METTHTPCPGDFIRKELEGRGWTQLDLARILDRTPANVNEIIQGKRAVLPDTALALGEAFGTEAEVWMSRESAYRLSLAGPPTDDVRRRARLYGLAPVKEMEKRGWIRKADDADALENELKTFFAVPTLDEASLQTTAVLRATQNNQPLTLGQRAWCCRVRQLARASLAADFRQERLDACKRELRKIAAYPQESYKISEVLGRYGIRFVVVEPLPSTKVDGVATWLDGSTPVIGMSLRYDRVDSLWHTLCHELSHILHRDESPLDSDLTDQMESVTVVKSEMERRADDEAASTLVPPDELQSFILRVGPLYSKERIIQFAHRMKIHPGIIVGQLQHRQEIGYQANREMLSRIREVVISAALTDGWGHTLEHRSIT